jgi:hypothetical protein
MTTTAKVAPGTKFTAIYQDSKPEWEVIRSRGRGVWEAKIVDKPFTVNGKTYPSEHGGITKVFKTEEILYSRRLNDVFAQLADEHESYFASLKIGEIVHYHNAFGAFVRCEVVMGVDKFVQSGKSEKMLKPIALVGKWNDYDLPHRAPDGSIRQGTHAKDIAEGECFKPNASNIYENKPSCGRGIDPRGLPAIDLTVPPMTAEQEVQAKLWTAVRAAQAVLGESDVRDPKARLEEALKVIQAAL